MAGPTAGPGRSAPRRGLALAVGAALVAALAAGGWWLLRDSPKPQAARPRPPPEDPVRPPEIRAPAPPLPGGPPESAPPAPMDERDRFQGWSDTVAILPRDLGAMGPPLKLALDRVRNGDMAFCFRGLERSGEPGAESPPRHIRSADLLLYLQTREGAVDVVEAGVGNAGNLPPSVVACCREVIRGAELKVPFAEPGRRFRYLYEVEE